MSGAVTGACLCGAVRWRLRAPPAPMAHCHCSVCRKVHGTPFATYLAADGDALEFTAGESAMTVFESSPGFRRAFCRHCGASVPGVAPDGHAFVPAGVLDGDPGTRAKIHIFVGSGAPWHTITDSLRRFDAFPGRDGPAQLAAPRPPPAGDGPAGSCACGAVRFEVPGPVTRAYHCHCGRCRRARAAAHASNAWTAHDGVRFVAGQDRVRVLRLPGARHFAQAFCDTCGAPMPRLDAARDLAVIPYGAFDRWPPVRPSYHIFTADRAPWFDITDDLPQRPQR